MKNLSRLLFAMLLVLSFNNTFAQDESNPWLINIGVNAVDIYPTNDKEAIGLTGKWFDEYFNASDHWNILPSLSTLTVSRYISDGFSVGVTGSINRIDKYGSVPGSSPEVANEVDDWSYYGVDGTVKYSFQKLINSKSIEPYLGVGGGYTWIDEIGAGTLNGAVGLTYWFTQNIGLNVQSSYKHAFEDYLQPHFQHSAGLSIKFGGQDTDGDGINDDDDACPEVAGLEMFNGCPDTDGDGIEDSKDDCPTVAGLAEFNGCPDTDGDGVADKDDNCPTVAGLKSLAGCPDADGDGVADKDDNCPNEAGPAANNGCPWPDTDGDGVLDKDDLCKNEAGPVANNGCPKNAIPDAEVIDNLNSYARTILFDTGKSSFKQETYPVLQAITGILKEYPEANFNIGGHTDSVGSKATNQALSERRANAVRDYLITNGVSANRLTAAGYGEDYPVDSNATAAGRRNNRRVEVKLND